MKNPVLIICYSFPPFPGIGGRRWAKFARIWTEGDRRVFVLGARNPFGHSSNWVEDVKGVTYESLPLNYPSALITFPTGVIGKLRYHLGLLCVKFLYKGNYYDRTIFWKKNVLEKASHLIIKESIKHIIISGAPFSLFRWGAELKAKHPEVKLIGDIRDPWTTNSSAYGFFSISTGRQEFERKLEREVFKRYSVVFTVSESLTDYFKNLYKNQKVFFETVHNGFDPQECAVQKPIGINFNEENINFCFAGSFYNQCEYLFVVLIEMLRSIKKQLMDSPVTFHFYGSNVQRLKYLIPEDVAKYFEFGYLNTIQEVNWVIDKSDYWMLFLSDDINYSFSTKFNDYIKYKKKILVFSKPGLTSRYVVENELGFVLSNESDGKVLLDCISNKEKSIFPMDFDCGLFSIESQIKNIDRLIDA